MQKYSTAILQQLKETNSLLNNLLDWAGSQLNRMEFKPKNLMLISVIKEVTDQLAYQIHSKSIDIQLDIPSVFKVLADQKMLETTLRNLISNAIKFSHPNGIVRIMAVQNDGEIEIHIQDCGIGINESHLKQLFSLSETSTRNGTSGEKGTGLGLHLVQEFVAMHGGRITVKSEENLGSTFIVHLPA